MSYDLAAVLRAEGLTVVEEADWPRRGYDGLDPDGLLVHHTATGPKWTEAQMRKLLVTHGRPDLPGPLCNLWLTRQGVVHVVAARRANHAGPGSGAVLRAMLAGKPLPAPGKDDTHGNRRLLGVECENDGVGEGWPQAQTEALARLATAICRAEGWASHRVISHKEWTRRKSDPHGVSMASLRDVVAHRLAGPAKAQPAPTNRTVAARPVPSWEEAAVASLPVIGKGAGGGKPNLMVARLQALLLANGAKITVDGAYGPKTQASVVAFQKRAKITADGVCGRGTWTKLLGL